MHSFLTHLHRYWQGAQTLFSRCHEATNRLYDRAETHARGWERSTLLWRFGFCLGFFLLWAFVAVFTLIDGKPWIALLFASLSATAAPALLVCSNAMESRMRKGA